MRYCIEIFGNNWGFETMDESDRRSPAFTKKDCAKLQVLQNTILKLQTGLPRDYPTNQLLTKTGNLSIHQLIAFQTLTQVFKVINNKKPHYLSTKFNIRNPENNRAFPHRKVNTVLVTNSKLSITRGGFIFRGQTLWNLLPASLRNCKIEKEFKTEVRNWVSNNIGTKPP